MKKFHLLLVAEEIMSKSRSRVVEEIVIGEYSTMEELQEGLDAAAEDLNLVKMETEDDE